MAETLNLTAAIVPPSRTTYSVQRIVLDWNAAAIQVWLKGSDNVEVFAEYTGDPATQLMITLNKVNLTVKSLQRRILEQLVSDNKLPAGSVTGTPA